jgi:hypothetical protein
MDILVWSTAADTLWLALKLTREGHAVTFHVEDPDAAHVGAGLIPRTTHPAPPGPETLVVFDDTGHGAVGSAFRARGAGVLGGNPADVMLEVDRAAALDLARAVGLAVPPTHSVPTLDAAADYLWGVPDPEGPWFVKCSGPVPTWSTLSGPAPQLVPLLRWLATQEIAQGLEGVLVQRAVPGVEVSTEGWFNGTDFVPGTFTGTIEEKRLFPGGGGPRTGCQANVVWAWPDDAPLVAATVRRYTERLRAAGYVGPFDVNAIVTADGTPVVLEHTARLGFDAFQAWTLLLDGPLAPVLDGIARGATPAVRLRPDVLALTVRVSLPPYPAPAPAPMLRGRPLPGLEPEADFFPTDVMAGRDTPLACAGMDGSLGVFGAVGPNWRALLALVVARAAALGIPELQYRREPVPQAVRTWVTLASLGLLPAETAPARALGITGRRAA